MCMLSFKHSYSNIHILDALLVVESLSLPMLFFFSYGSVEASVDMLWYGHQLLYIERMLKERLYHTKAIYL
jgi:hypothetical protein